MSQLAYAVFYQAYRNGSSHNYQIMFQADEYISTGEQMQSLTEQVARAAVSNGQANGVSDVSITGISLLNNAVAYSKQDARAMLADSKQDDSSRIKAHIDKIEAENTRLYEKNIDLTSAFVDAYNIAKSKGGKKFDSLQNEFGRLYDELQE